MEYKYIEQFLEENKEWGLSISNTEEDKEIYIILTPKKYWDDIDLIFKGDGRALIKMIFTECEEASTLPMVIEESLITGLEKLDEKVKQIYEKEKTTNSYIHEVENIIKDLINYRKGIPCTKAIYIGEEKSLNENRKVEFIKYNPIKNKK